MQLRGKIAALGLVLAAGGCTGTSRATAPVDASARTSEALQAAAASPPAPPVYRWDSDLRRGTTGLRAWTCPAVYPDCPKPDDDC